MDPWTNVYGWARSLLAVSTAATLAINHSSTLFRPGAGVPFAPYCAGPSSLSVFCQFGANALEPARWLAVALLLVVASGWRPRITGAVHWWISFSFFGSAITVDGGDQMASVLTLLLLPLALTDDRKWHWETRKNVPTHDERYRRLVALSAWWVVRIQVALVYFHAAVGKMAVDEWANGTAMYYWWNSPSFGAPAWLQPLTDALTHNGFTVTLLTWGSLGFEVVLFMALTMQRRWWSVLLPLGIGFHAAIAVTHGLPSFSAIMSAALILYLRPLDAPFARSIRRPPVTMATAA